MVGLHLTAGILINVVGKVNLSVFATHHRDTSSVAEAAAASP